MMFKILKDFYYDHKIMNTLDNLPNIEKVEHYTLKKWDMLHERKMRCTGQKARKILPLESLVVETIGNITWAAYDRKEFEDTFNNKFIKIMNIIYNKMKVLKMKDRVNIYCEDIVTWNLILDICHELYYTRDGKSCIEIAEYLLQEIVIYSHDNKPKSDIGSRIKDELEYINVRKR